MTKRCFKCNEEKHLDLFYAHPRMSDGYLNKCKKCTKQDVKTNYSTNREHYAEYEKKRWGNPERRRYSQSLVNSNKSRKQTHSAVSNAIRDGKMSKKPCVVCGETKVQAHHHDYSKPLDVVWLCRKHHLETHGKTSYQFQ